MHSRILAPAMRALCGTAALFLVASGVSADEGHTDLSVGSSSDGSGSLLTEFNFESVVIRTDFAAEVGPVAVYQSENPGIAAAADEAPDIFELDIGTAVDFEVVAVDGDLQLQFGPNLLSSPGDSAEIGVHDGTPGDAGAFHTHPLYQVLLDAPKGEFGEGTVSFRFKEGAAGPGYGQSDVYNMKISNGYLPPVESPDNGSASCQKTVGNEQRKLIGKAYKNFTRCLDAIQKFKAGGGDIGVSIPSNVAKACSDPANGVLARNDASRAAAQAKAESKCGGVFTPDQLSPHFGMGVCRVQELIGAAYPGALEDLAVVVFGDDEALAEEALPCLKETQGSTLPE